MSLILLPLSHISILHCDVAAQDVGSREDRLLC